VFVGLIALSTGWLPRLEDKPYYKLSSVLSIMDKFSREHLVDGFEFGLLPEWNSENPPLTPAQAPSTCEKHSSEEILELLKKKGFSVLTVHASRDVGSYLCAEEKTKLAKGIRLVDESLRFCQDLGSKVCVFHFWNPWKKNFDLAGLQKVYEERRKRFSNIEFSVENIPTMIEGKTPFQLMQGFEWRTLDLKWASMYNEFDLFAEAVEKVDNVHVQGKCQDGSFVPTVGSLDYEKALERIVSVGYSGVFTLELEGKASYDDIAKYVKKLRKLVS